MKHAGLVLFLVTVVSLGALHALPKKTHRTYELPINPAALYQSDNELYFDNKLPPAIVVGEEPDGASADHVRLALTQHDVGTHWYKIQISPRYNPFTQDEEGSVIHEACHIYVWEKMEAQGKTYEDAHGDDWQSCMEMVAAKHGFRNIW